MNKLLVALIAASFATVAGAQTGATAKEKAKTVESVTKSQAAETTGAGPVGRLLSGVASLDPDTEIFTQIASVPEAPNPNSVPLALVIFQ